MDAARGTAILLLLLWHASAVPELLGTPVPSWIRSANAFFLPFRMPTLMLLSGLLLPRSLSKPLPQYYAGKLSMVLWPYLVWVVIAKVVFLDIEGMPWYHWRAWYATSYLWFLFFIGVYYLLAPAFLRLPSWLPVAVAFLLALLFPHESTEQRMAYFAVFFFAGNWLSLHPVVLERATSRAASLVTTPLAIAFGIVAVFFTDVVEYSAWGAFASIAGSLSLLALFSLVSSRSAPSRLLQVIGRSSIVFYVSHFPVMVIMTNATAAVLPPLILAGVNFIVACLAGWMLMWARRRIPTRWLFEAPQVFTRAARYLLDSPRRAIHRISSRTSD